jgi:hypothetical protein
MDLKEERACRLQNMQTQGWGGNYVGRIWVALSRKMMRLGLEGKLFISIHIMHGKMKDRK